MPTIKYRTKDGKRCKGVTTILGVLAAPALVGWAYKQGMENYNRVTEIIMKEFELYPLVPEGPDAQHIIYQIRRIVDEFKISPLYEKRDRAATAGTLAHLFVENHIKGLPEPSTEGMPEDIIKKAFGCQIAFLEWERSHKLKMLHSELPLVSEKYRFGGCIDIGAVLGETSLLDYKTSKGLYLTHKAQVAAYAKLWDEHYPDDPIKAYHILRTGEKGEFEHKYFPELNDYWEIFLACLRIDNILDSLGEKL